MQAPLYFSRPGCIDSGSLSSAGNGYYWSSTVNNSELARYLYFYSSYIIPENSNNRYNGFSVRCVLRESKLPLFLSNISKFRSSK